jgi:DNA polymerase I
MLSVVDGIKAVWVVDFEFCPHPTGLPDVVCLAARELHTGRTIALWRDQLGAKPPYDIGEDAVFVCYSGMEAELAAHLSLGWPLPINVVDLIVEYRMSINGRGGSKELGMLAACARLGVVPTGSPSEKSRIRDRIIAGWPFTIAERKEILCYCVGDVADECSLLRALDARGTPTISPHALWRGMFIKAVARMWYRGVPIDQKYVSLATDCVARAQLKQRMVEDIQVDFPIYDHRYVLKNDLLERWLESKSIPVPRTPTGKAATSQGKLGSLSRGHPVLIPLVESLSTQGQLKDFSLPIGSDLRLRAWFAPFLTITSRAAPPTNGYVYNLPAWMRAAIRPPPGYALAYLDFGAMEFGLAATLSGDRNMIAFYNSGEPYLATAVAAGALPPGVTKASHPVERDLYKTGDLACLYGIGEDTLATRLRRSTHFAREFLAMHHRLFAEYWDWSDGVVREAIHSGIYCSRHGWVYAVSPPFNVRWSCRGVGGNWCGSISGGMKLSCHAARSMH